MLFKRISRFEIIIILILLISHTVVSVTPVETLLRWYPTDDAFYYFRVARNIGEGYGITFDRIGSTNGFHPLWMLVCIPIFTLARINVFLPLRVLVIILGLFQAATGILLFRTINKIVSQPIAKFVAILWIFAPFVNHITAQNGLEAGISAFFLALTLYMIAKIKAQDHPASTKQLIMISLVASCAFLSRLDNIIVITMLGIWLVFRSSPIRYYLILDILAIAVSVFLSYMIWVGLNLVFFQYGRSALVMIALGVVLKVTASYFFGIYQPPLSTSIISRIKGAVLGISIGSACTAIVMIGLAKANLINGFSRMALLFDWGISILLIVGIRLLIDWLATGMISKSTAVNPLVTLRLHGKSWAKNAGFYFGILGAVMVAYFTWNYLQFGTLTPVSGQIKEWWGTIYTIYGRPSLTPTTFFGIDTRFVSAQPTDNNPVNIQSRIGPWVTGLSWLMMPTRLIPNSFTPIMWVLYGGIGLAVLKLKRANATKIIDQISLMPLMAGCFLHVWILNARGYVGIREWYWVAELLFTCLMCGIALHSIISLIPQQKPQKWVLYTGSIILCISVFYSYIAMLDKLIFLVVTDLTSKSYLANVKELESTTEPGSVIGMTGGGDMSYLIHDRTIVNLDGLISSYTYFKALKNSQSVEYLASINLNYVYGVGDILTQMDPYQVIFKGRLKNIAHFDDLAIFRFLEVPNQ